MKTKKQQSKKYMHTGAGAANIDWSRCVCVLKLASHTSHCNNATGILFAIRDTLVASPDSGINNII